MPLTHGSLELNVHPILGALRSVPIPPHEGHATPTKIAPFVTISREPAIDAEAVTRRLVDLLNEDSDDETRVWTGWDRELVEAVAAKEHLSKQLIESLEDASHSWMTDFFRSLSFTEAHSADETRVYKRVASMIRALAQAGRVVIIGRGGVQVTRHMPGGLHVRLVAPFECRLENYARQKQMVHQQAAPKLRELDHNRQAFYHRYWPQDPLSSIRFAMTLNAAELSVDTMAVMIHCAIRGREDVSPKA